MPDRPLLIFDGHCGFCRIWIEYWKRLTGDRIRYAASQDVGPEYPQIPREEFGKSVQLVLPSGEVLSGAHAVFETLHASPEHAWLSRLYAHTPIFATLMEWAYRLTAAHRNAAYQITRIFFGTRIEPARFAFVEWLFVRCLAAIYLAAFVSFGVQITGLIGSHGILPLGQYLEFVRQSFGTKGFWYVPTLFWIDSSDAFLQGLSIAGAAISIVLLFGIAQRACLVLLFILYLSLCSGGQDFMSFQWDMLLLEAGFLAIFLGSSRIVIWLFRWLLFRLMFLSGSVKLLSHDAAWRSLDALRFHYWTQPLPSPIAWYMNQLPVGFQRASTVVVFLIELAAPFLIFFPRRARIFGAGWLIFLQTMIMLTGNYAFFNVLTLALCLFLFDDRAFGRLANWDVRGRSLRTHPRVARAVLVLIGFLSGLQLMSTFFDFAPAPTRDVMRLAAPFGIVNSYGLFAVMTTSRPEIIVQGSNDGSNWMDYSFKYKPGDLRRAPRWVAPHQPRLDWQMWFAALSNWRNNPWFVYFMRQLLGGSPEVAGLLERNPFPGAPPKYVRALLFEYRFTDWRERAVNGDWWKREPKGMYFPAVSLNDFRTK